MITKGMIKGIGQSSLCTVATGVLVGLFVFLGSECLKTAWAQDTDIPLLIVPGATQKDVPRAPVQRAPQNSPAPILKAPSQPKHSESNPVHQGLFGIEVGGLDDINPEAVGILPTSDGDVGPWRKDLGRDLWFASDIHKTILSIKSLPNAANSLAAQELSRQILLTAAAANNGREKDSKATVVAARIEKLVEMGHPADALALANLLPRSVVTEPVLLAKVQAEWLTEDVKTACAAADTNARDFDTPIWSKMQAACAAIVGNADRAQLKLALLDELNLIDAGFQPIADKILGRKKLSLAKVPAEMGVFEAAAFKAIGGRFPEDLPLKDKPWLAMLAIPDKGPVTDGHLMTAEFGLAHGILSVEDIGKLYKRVRFSKKERKAVLDLKTKADTPRGRALYWVTLQRAESVAARIEILSQMLSAAHSDPRTEIFLAILLAKPMEGLSDNPVAAWMAGDGVRLALWSGNWAEAKKWAELAKQNAGASEQAAQALLAVQPLMTLVAASDVAAERAALHVEPMLKAWSGGHVKRGLTKDKILQLRDRMMSIFRVMSLPIHDQDWALLLADPAKPYLVMSPSPIVTIGMVDAASLRARGLTMSSVASQLGALTAGDPSQASPQVVNTCVQTLLQISAVDWAKRIAIESLLLDGA